MAGLGVRARPSAVLPSAFYFFLFAKTLRNASDRQKCHKKTCRHTHISNEHKHNTSPVARYFRLRFFLSCFFFHSYLPILNGAATKLWITWCASATMLLCCAVLCVCWVLPVPPVPVHRHPTAVAVYGGSALLRLAKSKNIASSALHDS